jgi:redox-sensitive bicupin YhaK (pirin superfamily)
MKNEINLIIEARAKDIGIVVRRILPWTQKRMVGPFIFLDHMGPAHMHPPKDHMDVRPHPHIGLSTLTYLFDGAIVHRDSLGVNETILPGEVNWMTSGKGIAHSERESIEARHNERTIHGLQFWVALPKHEEDRDPSFEHYGASDVPKLETGTSVIEIIAGSGFGKTSPLKAYSPMTFMVVKAKSVGSVRFDNPEHELAVYVAKGSVTVAGKNYEETNMIVFKEGSEIEFDHSSDALVAILGGQTFPEERYIEWNFVSSSKEKIEQAKKDWMSGNFPQVPGDPERIPIPGLKF